MKYFPRPYVTVLFCALVSLAGSIDWLQHHNPDFIVLAILVGFSIAVSMSNLNDQIIKEFFISRQKVVVYLCAILVAVLAYLYYRLGNQSLAWLCVLVALIPIAIVLRVYINNRSR